MIMPTANPATGSGVEPVKASGGFGVGAGINGADVDVGTTDGGAVGTGVNPRVG